MSSCTGYYFKSLTKDPYYGCSCHAEQASSLDTPAQPNFPSSCITSYYTLYWYRAYPVCNNNGTIGTSITGPYSVAEANSRAPVVNTWHTAQNAWSYYGEKPGAGCAMYYLAGYSGPVECDSTASAGTGFTKPAKTFIWSRACKPFSYYYKFKWYTVAPGCGEDGNKSATITEPTYTSLSYSTWKSFTTGWKATKNPEDNKSPTGCGERYYLAGVESKMTCLTGVAAYSQVP